MPNQRLENCIKTNEFNFLRINPYEKPQGGVVIVNYLLPPQSAAPATRLEADPQET
jgi:hypothetical protein